MCAIDSASFAYIADGMYYFAVAFGIVGSAWAFAWMARGA
jgi:hypothetical protein